MAQSTGDGRVRTRPIAANPPGGSAVGAPISSSTLLAFFDLMPDEDQKPFPDVIPSIMPTDYALYGLMTLVLNTHLMGRELALKRLPEHDHLRQSLECQFTETELTYALCSCCQRSAHVFQGLLAARKLGMLLWPFAKRFNDEKHYPGLRDALVSWLKLCGTSLMRNELRFHFYDVLQVYPPLCRSSGKSILFLLGRLLDIFFTPRKWSICAIALLHTYKIIPTDSLANVYS
ncbi:hypothetical protein B0H17DRAFT_1046122 [Mycena rosella]|uniref:Uncharacterized protein n=1 Tax=Mycena rosella TaxID=1033263 RepID=A0AAD7DX86_MYCRO|nr:hypothetical protein B0H17DRAFT_1046122 [Mycena rosella]